MADGDIDADVDRFLQTIIGNSPTRPVTLSQAWQTETVAKTSIPCDVVILPLEYQVAVAERKKGRVVIYGEEGKELRVLDREDIPGMKEPTSLCMYEHRMFMADVNQIHFINVTSWLEDRMWTPKKRAAADLFAVHGMAVNAATKEVVVSEVVCRAAVSVWDLDTERFKHLLKAPKNNPFRKPQHIACSADGLTYVSDCESHCVYIFDKRGKYVNVIGAKGQPSTQLIYPSGLDVTKAGEIIVADPPNGKIALYNAKGEYRYPILDHLDGLSQPLAVHFYDGHIAVTEEILEHGKDRNIVRLFQMGKKKGK